MTQPAPAAAHSPGTVWWITGLSGSGKTTIAGLLVQALREQGRPVLLLDGDVLRAVFGGSHGHSPEERQQLAMTYSRLALEVARQGIDAVCATMSMFHSVRAWNRAHIPCYREIYLRVPLEELERRDPRGLYARARAGTVSHVIGVDVVMEEPLSPDLVLDNYAGLTPAQAVQRLLTLQPDPAAE